MGDRRNKLAVLATLAAIGCAPRSSSWSPPTTQVEQLSVYGGNAAVASSIAITLARFESARGHVPAFRLYVTESYVQQPDDRFFGFTKWDGSGNYVVFAWQGVQDEVPWLYHELEHVLVGDPDHARRDWPAVELERTHVVEEITEGRSG